MNLKTFCEGIQLSSSAQQIIEQYPMEESQYRLYKQQFYNDRLSMVERVKLITSYRQLFLYLYVRFAIDAYEEYQIRGIEDEIYFATFADIQVWYLNCVRDYGEHGIEEYNWLQEHIQLLLFRLGRLQFQPYAMDQDLEVEGTKIVKNQIVLNVHIPQGEPLDLQKVEKSFERARKWFRGIPPIFICHTWLLYPDLSEILQPESNIIQFQKLFNIYHVDHHAREAEQRIFNKVSSDPEDYGEQTTLQRNARTYLMAGNKLGSAYGIKILK